MKKIFFLLISLLPALVQAQNVVNVEEAGSLRACVEAAGLADATELTITGPLNGTDLRCLRMMAGGELVTTFPGFEELGIDVYKGRLESIDLSGARIVAGGELYHTNYPPMSNLTFMYSQDDVLGDCLFEGCAQLRRVVLPKVLKAVGRWCFYGSGITEMEVPEGTERIMSYAFGACNSLKRVILPSSLETVEAFAFSGKALSEVVCCAYLPPAYGFKAFDRVDILPGCWLVVWKHALGTYKEADGWSHFKNIETIEEYKQETALQPIEAAPVPARSDSVIHDLQGRRLQTPPRKGVYISGGKKLVR